ncbi:MAG: ATP-binding cassette domain-containing protein [Polyangiaceae bacterium]
MMDEGGPFGARHLRANGSESTGNLTQNPIMVILSYYVTVLRRILRGRWRLAFLLASTMHALGHALLALAAGSVAVALAQRWGFAQASAGAGGADRPASDALADQAFFWASVGLAVVTVKSATGVYATYVQARLSGEVGAALRLELLDTLLTAYRVRQPRHADQGSAPASPMLQAVAALTESVHDVEVGLKQGLLGGARALAQLVPLGCLLVALSARTALLAALMLVAFGALLGKARSGYRKAAAQAAFQRAGLLEAADESVRHAELWVSYGAEAKARSNLRGLGEAIAHGTARLDARAAAMSGANEVLAALALSAAVGASRVPWFGAVADGRTLLAFAVAFFLAYRPLRELTDARLALARAAVAYDELRPTLGGTPPSTPRVRSEAARVRAWPLATLELRDLGLVRGACAPLTLRIEPGAIVVIAGPTGVGKTTLLRTLLGFERPASGHILFGGVSIGDAPAGLGERPFAWVPQDAPLLADTLDANICLGAPQRAARSALEPIGAAHLVKSLGVARLGAGGRAVSGGERQWIALARAIATCQPVLLLDEPTSGLDADAQQRVLEAVARLRGRRTVVLVTHRSEPIRVADLVVRLESCDPRTQAA